MDPEDFARLKESVQGMVAIKKGKADPSRSFQYKGHVLIEIKEHGKRVWHISDAARELAEQLRTSAANPKGDAPALDPKAIRETLKQSQEGFAELMGISVATLRGWEQGRRMPRGPARVLLHVTATHPEAVLNTVQMIHADV